MGYLAHTPIGFLRLTRVVICGGQWGLYKPLDSGEADFRGALFSLYARLDSSDQTMDTGCSWPIIWDVVPKEKWL